MVRLVWGCLTLLWGSYRMSGAADPLFHNQNKLGFHDLGYDTANLPGCDP